MDATQKPQEPAQEDGEEPVVSAIHDAESGPHSSGQRRPVEDTELPDK